MAPAPPDILSQILTPQTLIFVAGAVAFVFFLLWRRSKKGSNLVSFSRIAQDEVKGILGIFGEKAESGLVVMKGLTKFGRVYNWTEYNSLEIKAELIKAMSGSGPHGKDIGDLSEQQIALDLVRPEGEEDKKKRPKKSPLRKNYLCVMVPKGKIRSRIARRFPIWRTTHMIPASGCSVFPDRLILNSNLQAHEYPLGSKIFVYDEASTEAIDQIAFKVHSGQNLEMLMNFYERMIVAEPLIAARTSMLDKASELNKKKQDRQKDSMYEDI